MTLTDLSRPNSVRSDAARSCRFCIHVTVLAHYKTLILIATLLNRVAVIGGECYTNVPLSGVSRKTTCGYQGQMEQQHFYYVAQHLHSDAARSSRFLHPCDTFTTLQNTYIATLLDRVDFASMRQFQYIIEHLYSEAAQSSCRYQGRMLYERAVIRGKQKDHLRILGSNEITSLLLHCAIYDIQIKLLAES